ncbi:multicopper oxidase family protein [Dyella subtropica]|uniref:multicopper oxidase family protein n=1 Tax=Dyella subtropica TaxID=2992127 RepID=UPI00225BECF5|nr:multicopper oxidase domain-containing protein [Dyella subtropica]
MRLTKWLFGSLLVSLSTMFGVGEVDAQASRHPTPVPQVSDPCPRPVAGSVIEKEPALFSRNGVLRVRFSYQSRLDDAGRKLYCFMTPDHMQNPTLHIRPGDRLQITITNNLPPGTGSMAVSAPNCGASFMDSSSVNIHYHGANASPACHQDEVIKTLINAGETFQYDVKFPRNEPPGLYWYHPHIHGMSELALQGGAAGAIVVDGIENVQPAVAGLRQRVLVVRDQNVPGAPSPGGSIPSWDVTLNYVPITSPTSADSNQFVPAVLVMQRGEQQFWRVANAAADTILDLQYLWDGQAQELQLVARDGVPLNSQDGKRPGDPIALDHIVLPPASRAEFIVDAPGPDVKLAQLVTQGINTGPFGDNDPARPLATIRLPGDAIASQQASVMDRLPAFTELSTSHQRFAGLAQAKVAAYRTVYFDEIQPTSFFMAVEGMPKHVFDPNLPPDIVATQGTVEEWVIQNRTLENHEFHVHQIHFLVESQDNFEINGSPQVPGVTGQYLDMVQVPFWDGDPSHPYPSVKVRIDFRGPDVGDFVFHCHILNHEDLGMMNIIRVLPRGAH